MAIIKNITISGFRGILAPYSLKFSKGNLLSSMAIYGKNGTGKSSITDSFEWFHTEKILHLAREGAGPSSFPHKNAQVGESYVQIDFNDDRLKTVRLNYDHKKITKPECIGNINIFRQIAPHPCYIRFEDLTRFVYFTKTDRFDELAKFMGFTPQVELQKSLRRVSRKLKDEFEKTSRERNSIQGQICETLDINQVTEELTLKSLNQLFSKHNIKRADKFTDVPNSLNLLSEQVENDPRSKELSDIKQLNKYITEFTVTPELVNKLYAFCDSAIKLSSLENNVSDLLMLGLYEQAELIFSYFKNQGERFEICPLCKQPYKGDLDTHITIELGKLKQLKQYKDDLESKRNDIRRILPNKEYLSTILNNILSELNEFTKQYIHEELFDQTKNLEDSLNQIVNSVSIKMDLIEKSKIESLMRNIKILENEINKFDKIRNCICSNIDKRVKNLEKDESRKILVSDQLKAHNGHNLWTRYKSINKVQEALKRLSFDYDSIVDNFVMCNIAYVQSRFNVISSDVEKYFGLLEQDTQGLGKPKLKLLPDEDRAVELQVEFYGEPVFPAYRLLSESQLNSFGLAIFLASAKFFNKDFRFLILDDVINSFDGYKRPKVIDLLKQEFSDHQVLLLTHDSVWSERLFEAFPSWVRKRITRHEIGIGPIDTDGYSPLEIIDQLLDNDEAVRAGREMGPLLERHLQELCETFEVLVKYNQRNEYSLDPLLDRFCVRVKEKLNKDHALFIAIKSLQNEAGFRNLCAHWKNPEVELTSAEMKMVVDKWKAIVLIVRCIDVKCGKYVRYDGKGTFVCPCGSTRLEKV